jgi:biotin synthase-like enzyme
MKPTHFERAIFISWYCSKRDCAFCYLSSRKNIKQDPVKDRRSLSSILAEAIICKACKWKVEFISGGCDTYSDKELLNIIKNIYKITKQKQWLNLGVLNEKQLKLFKPYTEGVCGTVECITPKLRDRLCPSKPLKEIEDMFKSCDKLKLKKTITIIIGLGEKLSDFRYLREFVKKWKLDRITFYRLKPQKGTIFEGKKGPNTDYYVEWIKKTRKEFPKTTEIKKISGVPKNKSKTCFSSIKIVAGSWLSHLDEIHLLLKAGADSITKFPSIRKFNTKYAKKIEEEARRAGRMFEGSLTKVPKINTKNIDTKVKFQLEKYLKRMKFNQQQ